jgi:hypothetical protein
MLEVVKEFTPLGTLILVVIGWAVTYFAGIKSQISSKRRDRRVDNLFIVFQKLNQLRTFEKDTNLDVLGILKEIGDRLELFGTPAEIECFGTVAKELLAGGGSSIHKLIDLIRNDLREQLSMSKREAPVSHFVIQLPD